jgi:hypothetical protein
VDVQRVGSNVEIALFAARYAGVLLRCTHVRELPYCSAC